MNENFKDIFYFSRGEKNGIIVLLILLAFLIIAPYLYNALRNTKPTLNKEFEKEIAIFTQSLQEIEEPSYNNRLNQYVIERYDSLKLFHFNPNTTSKENFKKLGLTDKQVNTITNFLNKGGKFEVKEDFKKIYGIRYQQYQILKPYILLPDKEYFNITNNKDFADKTPFENQTDSLFVFDPNKASNVELKKLGLSEKQINTLNNYKEKYGAFKTKEDLKKIYGITNEQYNRLEPYIYIPAQNNTIETSNISAIELNSATPSQLISIKGIKEFTANAIIKYREKLGGFTDVNQLLEIKSINKEYFEKYKNNLTIDSGKIKKLSLNFSEVNELCSHPYLNLYQAKEIVKYRSINGPYREIKQLLDHKILLKTNYEKIKPYLSLE